MRPKLIERAINDADDAAVSLVRFFSLRLLEHFGTNGKKANHVRASYSIDSHSFYGGFLEN